MYVVDVPRRHHRPSRSYAVPVSRFLDETTMRFPALPGRASLGSGGWLARLDRVGVIFIPNLSRVFGGRDDELVQYLARFSTPFLVLFFIFGAKNKEIHSRSLAKTYFGFFKVPGLYASKLNWIVALLPCWLPDCC